MDAYEFRIQFCNLNFYKIRVKYYKDRGTNNEIVQYLHQAINPPLKYPFSIYYNKMVKIFLACITLAQQTIGGE